MSENIFIDSDVLIDFLIDREPFSNDAATLIDISEKEKVIAFTSVLCLANIHYVIKKIVGEKKSREIIEGLIDIIKILSFSEENLRDALKSDFKDFEDAIQNSIAIESNSISSIITRNKKDYKSSDLNVFTPKEYLRKIV